MTKEFIKRPSYRLTDKQKLSVETGSPFDMTVKKGKVPAPGAHSTLQSEINVGAFSFEKRVDKPAPSGYLKKGSGTGGLSATNSIKVNDEQLAKSPQRKKIGVPVAGAFRERANPPNTMFRQFYERGDLPVMVDQNGSVPKISWKVPIERIDYHHYLPLFMDGLRETEWPYNFLAEGGVSDMINSCPDKILPVIPQLIIPIKQALNTRMKMVMVRVIRVIKKLVKSDTGGVSPPLIGQALVPYYRQILPIFNIFKNSNRMLGDGIDYHQQKDDCLGDLINETLELLEEFGGEDAFINIKYLVPTYQSKMSN